MLSAFPFLTATEFSSACQAFADRVHAYGSLQDLGWSSVRVLQQPSGSILRLSKSISPIGPPGNDDTPPVSEDGESQVDQLEEDDDEALIRRPDPGFRFEVEYDIILSPTYRVPVLYFVLRNAPREGPAGMEAVYQYLVPHQYKTELKSVGVMGGISMGYHPESGVPAYFVHPCNTADAMKDVGGGRDITPETYLLLWLGLIGNCVNLHVPRELLASNNI
ncbi:hypothetical protein VTN00DRAFT_8550 [Thermoascus crustaceus]|uniref:uncharacterized protein n=1 Tax=Thermoascus crustaceus TaxID=5088 RepID=UPI003742F7C3